MSTTFGEYNPSPLLALRPKLVGGISGFGVFPSPPSPHLVFVRQVHFRRFHMFDFLRRFFSFCLGASDHSEQGRASVD